MVVILFVVHDHFSDHPYSLKCPVSAHWKCLAGTQRDEVLKAVRAKDQEEWEKRDSNEGSSGMQLTRRTQLEVDQTTEFICGVSFCHYSLFFFLL